MSKATTDRFHTAGFRIDDVFKFVNGKLCISVFDIARRLFIPNEVMEKIWTHGFTKTERLEDIDHIGAYVIAYMSNLEIPPEFESEYAKYGDIEEIDGKKYIKGKRLDFYPDGMQISRHSKGMTRPNKLTGDEAETALDLLNGMSRKTFSNVKEVEQKRDDGSVRTAYVETSQFKTERPW